MWLVCVSVTRLYACKWIRLVSSLYPTKLCRLRMTAEFLGVAEHGSLLQFVQSKGYSKDGEVREG